MPFYLYWVHTIDQFDDGFVVGRTPRAADTFVRQENFIFDPAWAAAMRLARLPVHLQHAALAVGSTPDDPRHVHWATPRVIHACGVEIVHALSPRVFFWEGHLFTEGVSDYLRRQRLPPSGLPEPLAANDTAPVLIDPRTRA